MTTRLHTLPAEWALREAFREWFEFVTQEAAGHRPEARDLTRVGQDLALAYRELGVEAGDRVYQQSAAAWRQETGRCPGCGQPVGRCERTG